MGINNRLKHNQGGLHGLEPEPTTPPRMTGSQLRCLKALPGGADKDRVYKHGYLPSGHCDTHYNSLAQKTRNFSFALSQIGFG